MGHMATWKLPPYENTPEWWEKHDRWRKAYNTCSECGSAELVLKNFSRMWGDGDLFCVNGHYVRMFDSG